MEVNKAMRKKCERHTCPACIADGRYGLELKCHTQQTLSIAVFPTQQAIASALSLDREGRGFDSRRT